MGLSNCLECGKLFNRTRDRVCPTCVNAEQEEFDKVLEYIRTERVYFVPQISEETGVAQARIMKWVREGKLELASDAEQPDACKRCGRPSDKGDICESCRKKLANEIATHREAMSEPPPKPPAAPALPDRMHHLTDDS